MRLHEVVLEVTEAGVRTKIDNSHHSVAQQLWFRILRGAAIKAVVVKRFYHTSPGDIVMDLTTGETFYV